MNSSGIDVTSLAQAKDLATEILGSRTAPLVLVTADGVGAFHFDVSTLRRELAGIAEVVTMSTGSASYEFEKLMPKGTHVFGGAARSYPPGFAQDPKPERSPIRFPQSTPLETLIADAVSQAGTRTIESTKPEQLDRVYGVVKQLLAGGKRALVQLDGDKLVTATDVRLGRGVRLDHVLSVGDRIGGELSRDGAELFPELIEAADDWFPNGCLTLAKVVKVTALRATLQVFPGRDVVLRKRSVTSDEDQRVDELLSVGDVVRARVSFTDRGVLELNLIDIDLDAELHPSVPIIAGGSPWLREGANYAEPGPDVAEISIEDELSSYSGQVVVAPDPMAAQELAAVRREVGELRGDILSLTSLVARISGSKPPSSIEDEIGRLRTKVASLEEALRLEREERASAEARLAQQAETHRERNKAVRDSQKSGESQSDGFADSDPVSWIHTQIQRIWAERTKAGDRDAWPLREYTLGPEFVASFSTLTAAQRTKGIRACVDAITGRDKEIEGRDLHLVRTGKSGNAPYLTRADGAKCWRSALERGVASARRLHYWELANNTIELSRIVLHDDMEP